MTSNARVAVVALAVAASVLAGSRVSTQTPAAQPPPAAPPVPPAAPAQAPPAAEAYTHDPAGRRDPFVSLLSRGADLRADSRPAGVAGLAIDDVAVRGIVKTADRFVAMLQAPDNRTYIVHVDDKLFDGVIKAITVDTVVFSQEVNDPLSLVKQREIRKSIRPLQEGK